MKLIIDIPDNDYSQIKEYYEKNDIVEATYSYIYHGTPLPKGHGRLKDVDWIDDNCPNYRTEDGAWCYKWEDIDNAPTIIEADNTSSEDKE